MLPLTPLGKKPPEDVPEAVLAYTMASTCEVVRENAKPAGVDEVEELAPAVAKKAPAELGPAAATAAVPGSIGSTSRAPAEMYAAMVGF
jgi:hypothetical protein